MNLVELHENSKGTMNYYGRAFFSFGLTLLVLILVHPSISFKTLFCTLPIENQVFSKFVLNFLYSLIEGLFG
jgi:hypothetical protein